MCFFHHLTLCLNKLFIFGIMKKLLLILLLPFIVSCSSDGTTDSDVIDDDVNQNDSPKSIKFITEPIFESTLEWSYSDLEAIERGCRAVNTVGDIKTTRLKYVPFDLTGFEAFETRHYALDTLIVNKIGGTTMFDFQISNRGDVVSNPKFIGHIQFNNFLEDDYLFLEKHLMYEFKTINYVSSNLTENTIDKMSVTSVSGDCSSWNFFDKLNYDNLNEYLESQRIEITVPYDSLNNALNVGQMIGRRIYYQTELGEGWDARFNNNYVIISKQINY